MLTPPGGFPVFCADRPSSELKIVRAYTFDPRQGAQNSMDLSSKIVARTTPDCVATGHWRGGGGHSPAIDCSRTLVNRKILAAVETLPQNRVALHFLSLNFGQLLSPLWPVSRGLRIVPHVPPLHVHTFKSVQIDC